MAEKVNENGRFSLVNAGIAQLVEQLICNQQVVGSNPSAGSLLIRWITEIYITESAYTRNPNMVCLATSWPVIDGTSTGFARLLKR